jgi:hypothetical protein
MSDVHSSLVENFSLTKGGPTHRLIIRLDGATDEHRRVVLRALLLVIVAWLPLFVFSIMQGTAYGTQVRIPFLRDFAANVRLLVALPILILSESRIDRTWRRLAQQFLKSGLVEATELLSFEAAIEKTIRLRDRVLPELVIFVLALVPSLFIATTALLMNGVTNWHVLGLGSNKASVAGWWFNVVSMPLFRFLLERWIWRMFLWTSFLWRVSRIRLYLVATHTDMAAGLGFLSAGQRAFSPIVFAGGAVIAAEVGNAIAYGGESLSSLKFPMISYGVIAILILVVPLLVVAPVLFQVKKKALLEFGALVTIHNQLFDSKWIRTKSQHDQVIFGNQDPSSLIDLGSSFTVVRQMGLVPIEALTLTDTNRLVPVSVGPAGRVGSFGELCQRGRDTCLLRFLLHGALQEHTGSEISS